MALVGNTLYVADTDAVLVFPYESDATQINTAPRKLVDLPAGTINHHWTKNLIASADGSTLYVTVGSNSNRSEEHTSELQSLMRISYAVFCLKKKKKQLTSTNLRTTTMPYHYQPHNKTTT